MMGPAPRITVILPVHNGMPFLKAALGSLWAQTFRDFEIVVVDDGSTDDTLAFLRSCELPSLRVFRQDQGGVACALNFALTQSRGELLARMDADDIAHPSRFAEQVRIFDADSELAICGTWFATFGAGPANIVQTPKHASAIRARLVFGSPIGHPTVMMRKEAVADCEPFYDGRHDGCEDYGLWARILPRVKCVNLPKVLLEYRIHANQSTGRPSHARTTAVAKIRLELAESLGLRLNEREIAAHTTTGIVPVDFTAPLGDCEDWLRRLRDGLYNSNYCDRRDAKIECANAWYRAVQRSDRSSPWRYARSSLSLRGPRTLWRMLRLATQRKSGQAVI
jgi:glycosyltransferase involved in cell wall biosynthesis